MNICVFTRTLQKGGAEKQSVLTAKLLSKNYRTLLIVMHKTDATHYVEWLKETSVKIIFLPNGYRLKLITLYQILKREKIDALFCYLLSTNVIGAIAGRLAGVKCIVGGIRNCYHPLLKEFILRFTHNYLTHYSISNHSASLDLLEMKKFRKDKLIFIPNGIEIKNCSFKKTLNGQISIITVARMVEQKDYFTAIDIIDNLRRMHSEENRIKFSYLIVGYGALKVRVEKYIRDKRLDEYISIVDSTNPDELLSRADIYLCTSLYEGLSNSILEAMNNCLPIVATDVGENSRLVQNNVNGFIHTIGDTDGLSRSCYKLMSNPSLRVYMGAQSHKILEDSYSLQHLNSRYCKFLENVNKNRVINKQLVISKKNKLQKIPTGLAN